jgi:hypothetical protein
MRVFCWLAGHRPQEFWFSQPVRGSMADPCDPWIEGYVNAMFASGDWTEVTVCLRCRTVLERS